MKLILFTAYFLATAYSVSATDYLECHSCLSLYPVQSCEHHLPDSLNIVRQIFGQNARLEEIKCCVGFKPEDSYYSVRKPKENYSCLKIDFEVDSSNGINHKFSVRTVFNKNFCSAYKGIVDAVDDVFDKQTVDFYRRSVNCYECRENLCNLSNSDKASVLLVLMLLGLIYLMQFYENK